MRILGLDTTTARQGVALLEDGEVTAESRLTLKAQHSRRLLPAVAELLSARGVAPGDVDAWAVTVGPGSFTGVRIGLATVQGLALASRRPVIGVSTLDVLAARIAGAAPVLAAVMDAERGDVFAGRYDGDGRPLGSPQALALTAFLEGLAGEVAFVGDAVGPARALIADRVPGARFPSPSLFLAGTLVRVAAARLAATGGEEPGRIRPLYLRAAHIRP